MAKPGKQKSLKKASVSTRADRRKDALKRLEAMLREKKCSLVAIAEAEGCSRATAFNRLCGLAAKGITVNEEQAPAEGKRGSRPMLYWVGRKAA